MNQSLIYIRPFPQLSPKFLFAPQTFLGRKNNGKGASDHPLPPSQIMPMQLPTKIQSTKWDATMASSSTYMSLMSFNISNVLSNHNLVLNCSYGCPCDPHAGRRGFTQQCAAGNSFSAVCLFEESFFIPKT